LSSAATKEFQGSRHNMKEDPGSCLMKTLVLRENQERVRIRRSPGDYTKHLPWVLGRVFQQTLCGLSDDEQGRCASSDVRGDSGRCVSSGVRQSSDPGGGPEPEADCKPACGELLGVLDEIQVLNRPTEERMPEPAVMRAREVPGEQTTVAMAASVGERVQETARLFNPRRSPSITWEGGEDDSALKDIRKQSAAQRVPAQLRSSFQPEPRREVTCTEHPKEPFSGKLNCTPTIKTQESIALEDRELSGDEVDAMRGSQQAKPPDETAAGVWAAPLTNAVRGRRSTGQAAEVAKALIPSPTSKGPPTARNGRPTASGMSMGATAATADEDAARETSDEELPERGSPVEVQQTLHQKEAAREAGVEDPVESEDRCGRRDEAANHRGRGGRQRRRG
jgi:hypothetical protein